MHLQRTCLFLQLFCGNIAVAALSHTPLLRRDTAPVINASVTIRNHDGVDVTSSFKVMVKHQSQRHILNNATETSLHDRQVTWGRLINTCPRGHTFIESHCTPNVNVDGSMQRYVYTCRKNMIQNPAITGARSGYTPRFRIREGYCDDYEVCLDVRTKNPDIVTAGCNRVELFEEWDLGAKDGRFRPKINGEIFDPVLSMYGVMSQLDKSTPIELDTFEIDAWNGEGGTQGTPAQTKKCRDCADIQIDKLAPETGSINIEARLMRGISTTAITGVLWLALITIG